MPFELGTKNEHYNADNLTDIVKFSFITGLLDTIGQNIVIIFGIQIDKYTKYKNRLNETRSLQPKARYIQMDHHQ